VLRLQHLRLQTIRFILVPGFDSLLILYTFSDGWVRIVRVLHANLPSELDRKIRTLSQSASPNRTSWMQESPTAKGFGNEKNISRGRALFIERIRHP